MKLIIEIIIVFILSQALGFYFFFLAYGEIIANGDLAGSCVISLMLLTLCHLAYKSETKY